MLLFLIHRLLKKKFDNNFKKKTCEINSAFLALDNRATENERHI